MTTVLSIGCFLLATAAVSAWVLRREIHRASEGPHDPVVAAALRREEMRQRPWEGRN
jgi:hypothetical protein